MSDFDIIAVWRDLLEKADPPKRIRLDLESPGDVFGENMLREVEEIADQDGPEAARERLQKELRGFLLEEAASVRSTAARLQQSADAIRPENEKLHELVGTNLSSVRASRGKTQRSFVNGDLKEALARSTYADLERRETRSVRTDTVEDMASALGADSRLLLADGAFLRAVHALLARADTWRGKEYSSNRSIREALQEALHSETFGELEELVNRSGPEMTPEVMDCLLRLPPLDDPGRDTPAARCGAVLGWEWGTDIPAYEEDHLAQFVQNIEEYSFTDFPGETGRRVIGVVVLGYMGYYLSRADEDQRSSAETPVDPDVWEDRHAWTESFIPEGLPEDVKP